ncbi:hypothetical protein BH11PSE2_BH11PSE2_11680 [soil metagenome]
MSGQHTIGSVLPLPRAELGADDAGSLWAAWTGASQISAYACARSALAALLRQRQPKRVWLPAYCCTALFEAAIGFEVLWYGVDAGLRPDTQQLMANLSAGDAVVGIDHFGRAPSSAFRHLAATRRDVLWIEDRAQAMKPDAVWGDVQLFSPRKLVGVADGGLLVSKTALPQPGAFTGRYPDGAQRARAADPHGLAPQTWFPAFQAQEAAFAVDDEAINPATITLLRQSQAGPLIQARTRNAAVLAAHLIHFALWNDWPGDFAALAFPVLIEDRDGVAAAMAKTGIFCARHWPDLPSKPDAFPEAHWLSRHMLSLPCDHRYDEADMVRVAEHMSAFAKPARL